jgi:Holliday junction resolvase RusA-like endonuclease
MTITFHAAGKPQTAGSKKAFIIPIPGRPGTSAKDYRAIITDDNPEGEKWKKIVVSYARAVHTGPPLEGPLQLDVIFTLERPKGHFGTGKNDGEVKRSAPEFPTTRPDTTKLLRCLEDGLTGILWTDDSQIVAQHVFKVYGTRQGAQVSVAPYIESLF